MVLGRGRFPGENMWYRGNSDPSPGNSQTALCWMCQFRDLPQTWETEKRDLRGKTVFTLDAGFVPIKHI